jgi:hypothetical protein
MVVRGGDDVDGTATLYETLIVSLLAPSRDNRLLCPPSSYRQEHVLMICYEELHLTTTPPIFYCRPICWTMTITQTRRGVFDEDTLPTTIETTWT